MANDPDDRPWERPSDRPERREEHYDERRDDPPYRGGGGHRERPYYEEPHRGVLILVLGIIGIVFCPVTGIFAWFMGGSDLRKMDAGQMDPEGRGLTQAGKIIGIISTIILVLNLIVIGVMLLGMFVFAGAAAKNAPAPAPVFAPAPNNQFNQPNAPVRVPMK